MDRWPSVSDVAESPSARRTSDPTEGPRAMPPLGTGGWYGGSRRGVLGRRVGWAATRCVGILFKLYP